MSLFGAHGIWASGVQVMCSINFASKALIVSCLFALPIAWLSWAYFQAQLAAVEFSEKERAGVHYLRASYPVLKLALQLRGAPSEGAGALTEAMDQSYAGLEKVQAALGGSLGTGAAFEALKQARAQAKIPGGDAVERFIRNTAHIHALIAVMNTATDGSNLTLDPDIDSYYVMDAAAFRLPDLRDRVGLMNAAGAAALRDGALSPAFRTAIDKAIAIAEFHNTNLLAGIGKAVLDELIEKRVASAQWQIKLTIAILVVTLVLAIYFFYSFYLVTRGGLRLISQHLQEWQRAICVARPANPGGGMSPHRSLWICARPTTRCTP